MEESNVMRWSPCWSAIEFVCSCPQYVDLHSHTPSVFVGVNVGKLNQLSDGIASERKTELYDSSPISFTTATS